MSRGKYQGSPTVDYDLIPLHEIATRMALAPKTVKSLHRDHGLPLVLFSGRYFGIWSDIIGWARTQKTNGDQL